MAAANSSSSDSDTGQIGRNSGPELVADVTYRAVPHDPQTIDVSATPVWWVRFELIADPTVRFGLDINGEVVLGRSGTRTGFVDLSTFDSGNFGVSRQHAMLRPTASNLYVLDLGSTNGTRRNGIDIGIKTPYGLANGDKLTFGHLEFFVRIVERPISQTAMLRGKADLSDALVQMAKAITSQLDIAEVLNQALEMALTLTEAGESAIWLIDEQSGDLLLVADLGIEDQAMRQVSLPVSDTMVGKVIESGQAMTASSEGGQEQIKVKTGYLVEAVTYVPLKLGGVAFGVLMVAHRESGRVFDAKDHEMLEAIADFAAIAVQNARIYEATDSALAERVEEVTSLNHALSHDLRNVLGSIMGYASLLTGENSADAKSARYAKGIMQASTSAAELIDQLLAMARVRDVSDLEGRTCNLVDVVKRAVSDLQGSALEKSITTEIHVEGAVREITGDDLGLYRCMLNLVDNAIKYSPAGAKVWVGVTFGTDLVDIQVQDTGPGIPEEDLPYVFESFFRGQQDESVEVGTGLGLAMVKTTVRAHGGSISAQNAEGGGALMTIFLPTG